jgi:hypothetical protein
MSAPDMRVSRLLVVPPFHNSPLSSVLKRLVVLVEVVDLVFLVLWEILDVLDLREPWLVNRYANDL